MRNGLHVMPNSHCSAESSSAVPGKEAAALKAAMAASRFRFPTQHHGQIRSLITAISILFFARLLALVGMLPALAASADAASGSIVHGDK